MKSYRESHQDPREAERYDEDIYASGTYDTWVGELEAVLLSKVVRTAFEEREFRYLDFACGTGRILSQLAPLAAEAVGVDVSEAMLRRAADRVGHNVRLIS